MRKLAAATSIVASAVVAVALALPASLAMAAAMPGDYAGKTESEITTALTAPIHGGDVGHQAKIPTSRKSTGSRICQL